MINITGEVEKYACIYIYVIHLWPPCAIGGDIVQYLRFLGFFAWFEANYGLDVVAGTGVIFLKWEGFYALSIQQVLCLPSCSRLRWKAAHRQRWVLEFAEFSCLIYSATLSPTALPPCWTDSSCEWLLGPKWQAPEIGRDRVRGLLPRRWRMKNTQKQRKKRRN